MMGHPVYVCVCMNPSHGLAIYGCFTWSWSHFHRWQLLPDWPCGDCSIIQLFLIYPKFLQIVLDWIHFNSWILVFVQKSTIFLKLYYLWPNEEFVKNLLFSFLSLMMVIALFWNQISAKFVLSCQRHPMICMGSNLFSWSKAKEKNSIFIKRFPGDKHNPTCIRLTEFLLFIRDIFKYCIK